MGSADADAALEGLGFHVDELRDFAKRLHANSRKHDKLRKENEARKGDSSSLAWGIDKLGLPREYDMQHRVACRFEYPSSRHARDGAAIPERTVAQYEQFRQVSFACSWCVSSFALIPRTEKAALPYPVASNENICNDGYWRQPGEREKIECSMECRRWFSSPSSLSPGGQLR